MAELKLTPGDLVKLKSGGPVMTVVELDADDLVWCEWFRGDVLERRRFVAASLAAEEPNTRFGSGSSTLP